MRNDSPWEGSTSDVQPIISEGGPFSREGYTFVLLRTVKMPDGSEKDDNKSVKVLGYKISGTIPSGRAVRVKGKEGKDGWVNATEIIDTQTGAVTRPDNSSLIWQIIIGVVLLVGFGFLVLSLISRSGF